jgi:hypothetical protein
MDYIKELANQVSKEVLCETKIDVRIKFYTQLLKEFEEELKEYQNDGIDDSYTRLKKDKIIEFKAKIEVLNDIKI